jgi:hypothetical protein
MVSVFLYNIRHVIWWCFIYIHDGTLMLQ